MTATRQYRPITNAETSNDAAITIAQLYEYSAAVNNMKHYALRHKLFFHTKIGASSIVSSGSTSEKVVLTAAPFEIPHGYNYFFMRVTALEAGTGSVTWRFYASRTGPYAGGPSTLDISRLGLYEMVDFVSDSGLEVFEENRWKVPPGYSPIYITATAQSSVGTATSELYTIDIYPSIV